MRERSNKAAFAILAFWALSPLLVAVTYFILYDQCYVVSYNYTVFMHGLIHMGYMLLTGLAAAILLIVTIVVKCKDKSLNIDAGWLKGHIVLFILAAWLLWCLMATLLAFDENTALWGTYMLRDGYVSYIIYALVFAAAFLLKDESYRLKLLYIFIVTADILTLNMVGYELHISVLMKLSHNVSSAVYMHPNHFGYYLCLALMACFGLIACDIYQGEHKPVGRVFGYASFAWLSYGLMINDTFGAFLGLVCGMLLMLILWYLREHSFKLQLLIPFGILLLMLFLSYEGVITNTVGETVGSSLRQVVSDAGLLAKDALGSGEDIAQTDIDQAGSGRMYLWKEALKYIKAHPILGMGPEGLVHEYYDTTGFDRPHNEYMERAVFCGIPSLLLFMALLFYPVVRALRKLKTLDAPVMIFMGMLAAYSVSAVFGVTAGYIQPYLFALMGFMASGPVGSEGQGVLDKN